MLIPMPKQVKIILKSFLERSHILNQKLLRDRDTKTNRLPWITFMTNP
jgi:hypothetical protein